jgi:GT2 family glycosyltransferase
MVSVIVLNWNGKKYIEQCLQSVLSQVYPDIEIIVVDNGSNDGSVEIIKEQFKNVRLIENVRNLGFGGGNNIGIRHARGELIAVLNNDAMMDKACIQEMVKTIHQRQDYGACASKILFYDKKDFVDAAGIVVFADGLSIGRGRLEKEQLYDNEEEVFFASGCCALYKREMLEDIMVAGEYYDEDFFAYADDTDLGWRARLRGWKCIYSPRALVYHAHSASSGNYSSLKAFLVERNRMWLEVKNFPCSIILYGHLYTFIRYVYQAYGAFTRKGASGEFVKTGSRTDLVKILIKSYITAAGGIIKMLKKRKIIQKARKITTTDMIHILKIYGIATKKIALQG